VCSGACDLGDVRVDLDPKRPSVIKADMCDLPFANESFQTVISDPPWRTSWFDRWRPFFELVRVCKVGGQITFNSYYVPWSKQVKMTELYVRQDERFANVSILPYSSVWLTVNFHPAGLARVAAERFAYRFGG